MTNTESGTPRRSNTGQPLAHVDIRPSSNVTVNSGLSIAAPRAIRSMASSSEMKRPMPPITSSWCSRLATSPGSTPW